MKQQGRRLEKAPKNNRKKPGLKLILLTLVVLLFAFVVGSVYGKYVQQKSGGGKVRSVDFYFTSDYLKVGGDSYEFAAGTSSVTIRLNNFADALRFSEKDVKYTVTIKEEGKLLETQVGSGTLAGGTQSYADVELTGLENGKTYIVTAIGRAGYKETLTARITIKEDPVEAYLELTQDNEHVEVVLWTKNLSGDAEIYFPDGLIPYSAELQSTDNYDEGTGNYVAFTYADNVNFQMTHTSHTYVLTKQNKGTPFDIHQFSATVGGKNAIRLP